MPRKAVRCVVELILHAVTAPGCWLPSKEETYLSVSLFSQFKNTKLLTSSFPILIDESFRFEKTYFTVLDVEDIVEILEDELVVLELLQLSEYSDGAIHLATYTNNIRDFLYPYETYKPSVQTRDREIFLERTVAFPGISPKLEFSSKVVIKESYSDELDALEDAFDYHKTTLKDIHRSKRRPQSCSPRRNGPEDDEVAEINKESVRSPMWGTDDVTNTRDEQNNYDNSQSFTKTKDRSRKLEGEDPLDVNINDYHSFTKLRADGHRAYSMDDIDLNQRQRLNRSKLHGFIRNFDSDGENKPKTKRLRLGTAGQKIVPMSKAVHQHPFLQHRSGSPLRSSLDQPDSLAITSRKKLQVVPESRFLPRRINQRSRSPQRPLVKKLSTVPVRSTLIPRSTSPRTTQLPRSTSPSTNLLPRSTSTKTKLLPRSASPGRSTVHQRPFSPTRTSIIHHSDSPHRNILPQHDITFPRSPSTFPHNIPKVARFPVSSQQSGLPSQSKSPLRYIPQISMKDIIIPEDRSLSLPRPKVVNHKLEEIPSTGYGKPEDYNFLCRSPSTTLAQRIEDINLYAYSDNRPPFVVRKSDEDLIGRQPGGLLAEQNAKSKPHKCIKRNQARSKIATVSFDGYNKLDAYANIKTSYLKPKTTRSLRSPVPRYDYSCQYLDDDLDDDSEVAGITSRVRDYYVPYRTRSVSPGHGQRSPLTRRVTSPGPSRLGTHNSRRDLYISPRPHPSIRYGADTLYERPVSRNNYLDNRKPNSTYGKQKYPEIDDYSAAMNGLDDHSLHVHINGNEPSKDLDIENYDRNDDEQIFAKRGDDFISFSGTKDNDRNVNGVRFARTTDVDRDNAINNMRMGRMDDYAIYGKRDADFDPYSRLSDDGTVQGLNQFDRKTGFGRDTQQSYEYLHGMCTGRDNTFERMSGRTRIEPAKADDIEDYSTRSGTGKYGIQNGGPDIGYDQEDSNHISHINTRNDAIDDRLDKYSSEVAHDGYGRNLDFDDEGNLYSKPTRYRKTTFIRPTDSDCHLASSMDNPNRTSRADAYWNQVLLKGTDGCPLPSRPVSPVLNKSRFRDRFSESPFFSTSNQLSERVSHVLSRNKLLLNSVNFSNSSRLSSELVN